MAYYNYKVVRDRIPNDFEDRFVSAFNDANGDDSYDSDANYNGHRWLLTAEYIDYLQASIIRGSHIALDEWFSNGIIHR